MSVVIIPTKNEYDNIYKLMNWFTDVKHDNEVNKKDKIGFLIVDDSEAEEYYRLEQYFCGNSTHIGLKVKIVYNSSVF